MTEAKFLSSDDPVRMLEWAMRGRGEQTPGKDISDRKLRLFAVACCYGVSEQLGKDAERYMEWDAGFSRNAASWAMAWAGDQWHPTTANRAALLREIVGNPWKIYAWTDCHDCRPSGHEYQFLDKRWLLWEGGTVPRLAQTIYESREWELLPQLADALEEAGCDSEELLMHLRGMESYFSVATCGGQGTEFIEPEQGWQPLRGPHVRGCWALDLLLGKE